MSLFELTPWRKAGDKPAQDPVDDWLIPLRQQMGRVFDDFLGTGVPRRFRPGGAFLPDMDVTESDSRIEVTAELPGMSEKEIEVTLTDGVLTIGGEKRSESRDEDKDRTHYRLERGYGAFRRSFRLPPEIDPKDVSAGFDHGVLRVTVGKTKPAKSATRRIAVKSAA